VRKKSRGSHGFLLFFLDVPLLAITLPPHAAVFFPCITHPSPGERATWALSRLTFAIELPSISSHAIMLLAGEVYVYSTAKEKAFLAGSSVALVGTDRGRVLYIALSPGCP
jgi:hypothetical protein